MNEEQRQFYKMTAALTLPIALQNLMDTAVSGADVLMLNFVGEDAISAASLAGQVQFVLNMIFYGLSSGTAVLCAQYWVLSLFLWAALLMATIPGVFLPGKKQ